MEPLADKDSALMRRFTIAFLAIVVALLSPIIWTQATRTISIDFSVFVEQMAARYSPERVSVAERWETLLVELSGKSASQQTIRVNEFFHRTIRYRTDQQLYSQEDYWASPLETLGHGLGDCEDWAIAKYISLRHLGVPDEQLRLIYVRARIGGARSPITQAHMVLGYYPSPDDEPMILDSLISSVLPASERTDLSPVFSFNSRGLWVGQGSAPAAGTPTARLSLWRDVIARMQQEGIQLQ
jgi:predicted transglutaminase-like cysteine proteinase